jgi:hypothetical protein
MLEDHGGFVDEADEASIGVVGGNDVAEAVVVEAARSRRVGTGRDLDVVIAGDPRVSELWAIRHPALRRAARFRHVAGPPGPLDDSAIEALAGTGAVFVCLDADTAAITAALDIAARTDSVPVIVPLGEWSGLSEVLASGSTPVRQVHPFMVFPRILDPDVLVAGTREILARAIHEDYLAHRRRTGTDDAGDPAMADWDRLPEPLKASNRAQAAHLPTKLARIGCGLAPLIDWDEVPELLTDVEVEALALLEHERYLDERLGPEAGEFADRRHDGNPNLVPWEALTEVGRERARESVRRIPPQLARAGYRMIRRPQPSGAEDIRP